MHWIFSCEMDVRIHTGYAFETTTHPSIPEVNVSKVFKSQNIIMIYHDITVSSCLTILQKTWNISATCTLFRRARLPKLQDRRGCRRGLRWGRPSWRRNEEWHLQPWEMERIEIDWKCKLMQRNRVWLTSQRIFFYMGLWPMPIPTQSFTWNLKMMIPTRNSLLSGSIWICLLGT